MAAKHLTHMIDFWNAGGVHMEHKEEEMSMAMEIVREYKKREKRRCIFDLVKTLVFCAAFCFVVVNAYFPNTASTPVAQAVSESHVQV